jgi:hypothetical protein
MSVYQVRVFHETQAYSEKRYPQLGDPPQPTPQLETVIQAGSEEGAKLKLLRDHPEFNGRYVVMAQKVY